MSHLAPRLVVAGPGSLSTNLLHGVALAPDVPDVRALAAAMLGSATLLSAEVEGRSYGGGVLKLETKEAERLLVPRLTPVEEGWLTDRFERLDRLVRGGAVDEARLIVDRQLGLADERIGEAALRLRQRRLGRKAARVRPSTVRSR
jgi:hypothetical protein